MKKIFTLLFIGFFIFSCEFDEGFEEMNVNPNAAAQIGVGNKFAKTILDTSGGRYENWRNSLIYNSTLISTMRLLLVTGLEISILELIVMLPLYGIDITHQLLKVSKISLIS